MILNWDTPIARDASTYSEPFTVKIAARQVFATLGINAIDIATTNWMIPFPRTATTAIAIKIAGIA